MDTEQTARLSRQAKASHESLKSRTCHAMARAEDMLDANGWTVLRRHASGGQEIFASTTAPYGRVLFCRIRQRTATMFGGTLDHAHDTHLGRTDPEDAASTFIHAARKERDS